MDALAAVAGILDGERAAGHCKVVVGFHAGRAGILGIFFIIGHAAAHRNHVRAAFHQDVIVGADALFHGSGRGYDQRAIRKLDIVFSFEAVSGIAAGIDFDGRVVHQADIVVRSDAGFALGVQRIDGQQAAAAENQLRLAEQDGLLVLVSFFCIGGRSAVGKGVGTLDHDERAFLVLVVERRAVRVGDTYPVQDNGLFLGPIHLEETIGSGSGELVDEHFALRIVHRDLVPVHANIAIGVAFDSSDA